MIDQTILTIETTVTSSNANQVFELAFGRILRMGSRATQPGDVEMYELCKKLIEQANEYL